MTTPPRVRRILMLSWEYPPQIIGGLGRHVGGLARALVRRGHHVTVITCGHLPVGAGAADADREDRQWAEDEGPVASVRDDQGVRVVSVAPSPAAIAFDDLLAWVLAFNIQVSAAALPLLRDEQFDVIHAHDWLVAHVGIGLADAWQLPLVATMHATEFGRHQGHLPGETQRSIHRIEGWLARRADLVITCSRAMRDEVRSLFGLPRRHVTIPNGVALEDFAVSQTAARAYRAGLAGPRTRIAVFAGRLEYEKGVQTVIAALRRVRERAGPVRFVVAGVGSYSSMLQEQAAAEGLSRHVVFTGFLDDDALRKLYAAADVVVTPSIYEPFGLVALEAMACGTPVIVSDTGGLREVAVDGAALRVPPADAEALTDAMVAVLTQPELAHDMVQAAGRRLRRHYQWDQVARRTAEVVGPLIDGGERAHQRPAASVTTANVAAGGESGRRSTRHRSAG